MIDRQNWQPTIKKWHENL